MRGGRDGDDAIDQARLVQGLQRIPGAARLAADDDAAIALGAQPAQRAMQPAGGGLGIVHRRVAVEAQHVVAGIVEDPDMRLRLAAAAVLAAGGAAMRPDIGAAGRAAAPARGSGHPAPPPSPGRPGPGGCGAAAATALPPRPDHGEVAGIDLAAGAAPLGAERHGPGLGRRQVRLGGGPAPFAAGAEGEDPGRRLLQETGVVGAASGDRFGTAAISRTEAALPAAGATAVGAAGMGGRTA